MVGEKRRGVPSGALVAVAAVALLVVGIGTGFLLARTGGEPAVLPNAEGVELPPSVPATAAPSAPATPAGEPVQAPTEAGAAIRAFLQAERARELERSFELLAPVDQQELGPLPFWRNLHADLPVLRDFTLEGVQRSGADRARATTTVRLRPLLDEFVGLIPGTARAEWPLRRTGDGWRVVFSERTLEPIFPAAVQAVEDTRDWVRARQACEPAGLEGGVYGRTDLADALCNASGAVRLGQAAPLEPGPETAELTAAFGEEVFSWSQVVDVRAPVRLRAVLAPIGDVWEVIGVLPPGP